MKSGSSTAYVPQDALSRKSDSVATETIEIPEAIVSFLPAATEMVCAVPISLWRMVGLGMESDSHARALSN